MAIGWLVLLKSVPWTEVIANAPKVAEGAKKLWNTVGRKPPPRVHSEPVASAEQTPAELQARLEAAEAAIADLHEQMLASSELIKALAEQNTRLIEGVEANRTGLRRLTGIVLVLALVAVTSLALILAR